ncbi:alanyl-tRNA editing protein [Desulfosporosinus sp. PR]|uniref:alanyl-tRNA editing protein n=1 Tax=Candidatus Desulfosporosinus nitrosoreducens TaxID=3401928 RepID=UPI0027E5C5DF|nr:alanyl-tRNA editing protein [Desulfosporosinus sp. PR]MDQ7096023.1 alanyl-tRNA editing protein [Desulfosporosinus sp. PR]
MMSVEKVFWADPYQTQLAANVTSISGNIITLDKTIAYAFSGGQASDQGTINGHKILAAQKVGKEIYYSLAGPLDLNVDDEVRIEIDWKIRYRIMRLHFAAEIILELVNQLFDKPEKIGANITDAKARIDFVWQGNISGIFPRLLEEANRLIALDLKITSEFSDKESERRFWEVKDLGKVSCGGTHLRTTGEVGEIKLKRENIGKNRERIEIVLV